MLNEKVVGQPCDNSDPQAVVDVRDEEMGIRVAVTNVVAVLTKPGGDGIANHQHQEPDDPEAGPEVLHRFAAYSLLCVMRCEPLNSR